MMFRYSHGVNKYGMRYRELIEAPIADIHVLGDPNNDTTFDQGTGFDTTDQKMITRGREHYIRAFSRTPHVFEIFFINDADLDGSSEFANDVVDDYAEAYGAGIHDSVLDIQGKPGVIRHVQFANLSPIENRIPMTPWILAHKIAHAIQDSLTVLHNYYKGVGNHIRQINRQLYDIALMIGGEDPINSPIDVKDTEFGFPHFNDLVATLTMQSARSGRLNNPFEVWAEVVAQYLVGGRVTMRVGPDIQPLVNRLNDAIRDMFTSLEGKVTLEV
jgi:hypothetical protein